MAPVSNARRSNRGRTFALGPAAVFSRELGGRRLRRDGEVEKYYALALLHAQFGRSPELAGLVPPPQGVSASRRRLESLERAGGSAGVQAQEYLALLGAADGTSSDISLRLASTPMWARAAAIAHLSREAHAYVSASLMYEATRHIQMLCRLQIASTRENPSEPAIWGNTSTHALLDLLKPSARIPSPLRYIAACTLSLHPGALRPDEEDTLLAAVSCVGLDYPHEHAHVTGLAMLRQRRRDVAATRHLLDVCRRSSPGVAADAALGEIVYGRDASAPEDLIARNIAAALSVSTVHDLTVLFVDAAKRTPSTQPHNRHTSSPFVFLGNIPARSTDAATSGAIGLAQLHRIAPADEVTEVTNALATLVDAPSARFAFWDIAMALRGAEDFLSRTELYLRMYRSVDPDLQLAGIEMLAKIFCAAPTPELGNVLQAHLASPSSWARGCVIDALSVAPPPALASTFMKTALGAYEPSRGWVMPGHGGACPQLSTRAVENLLAAQIEALVARERGEPQSPAAPTMPYDPTAERILQAGLKDIALNGQDPAARAAAVHGLGNTDRLRPTGHTNSAALFRHLAVADAHPSVRTAAVEQLSLVLEAQDVPMLARASLETVAGAEVAVQGLETLSLGPQRSSSALAALRRAARRAGSASARDTAARAWAGASWRARIVAHARQIFSDTERAGPM